MAKNIIKARYITFFLIIFSLTFVYIPKSFGSSKIQTGIGYNETWGNYGTNYTTSLIYIPLNINYYPNSTFNFSATIPYEDVSKPASATLINGVPVQRGGVSSSATTTESGLGDIVLTGNYNIINQLNNHSLPTLTATAFVDLPTASESKGLGTGQTNFGFNLGLTQLIKSYFYFINGGYTVLGKPSGVNGLSNPLSAYAGAGKLVTNNLSFAVSGAWTQAFISGTHDTVTGNLSLIYTVVKNNTIGVTYIKGFTNESPSEGIMLNYTLGF
jgi:hypothetical protein